MEKVITCVLVASDRLWSVGTCYSMLVIRRGKFAVHSFPLAPVFCSRKEQGLIFSVIQEVQET